MKLGALFAVFVLLGLSTSEAFAACDFKRPHSFDCQHETFAGDIFPMVRLAGTNALNAVWFANQYTPGSRQGEGLFETLISPTDHRRTCALLNEDGSAVGSLRISLQGRLVRGAQISNFRSQNFEINRPGGFEDSHTVVFANTESSQIFKCRIFERAGANHLTCQYFEGRQFMGYVGFLPFRQACR